MRQSHTLRLVQLAPLGALVLATLAAGISGYRSRFTTGAHDQPSSASLARAALVLEVELPARFACDEAFDVALYGDRGVELVAWEPGARSCRGRHVTVTYLPARIRRATLLERIERLAISVKVVEG